MEKNNVNIDKIRGYMAEKKIKQSDIANALGLHINSVQRRMTGLRPFRTIEIGVIADMFGCKTDDLMRH